MKSLRNEVTKIENFLIEYRNALESFNAESISSFYSYPFLFVSEYSTSMYFNQRELTTLFEESLQQYKLHNFSRVNFEILDLNKLTPNISIVKVRWDFMYSNMELIYDCEYSYTVRANEEGDYKFTNIVSINEVQKLNELLRRRA